MTGKNVNIYIRGKTIPLPVILLFKRLILLIELNTVFALQKSHVPMQLNSLLNQTVWLHTMIGDPLRKYPSRQARKTCVP